MISMPYGKKFITIEEPTRYILAIPRYFTEYRESGVAKQEKLINRILKSPTDRPALSEWLNASDTVAITIPDITRRSASAYYLLFLLKVIESVGILPERVVIIIATGNHRKNSAAELEYLVGSNVVGRYEVVNHDSKSDLVYIGTTSDGNRVRINRRVAEAKKIILTGASAFHIFAGYSGGRKGLLPGVSASETILYNHSQMFKGQQMSNSSQIGVLENNSVHEGMLEGLKLIDQERVFLLNTVCDLEGNIINAFAGCPIKAHYESCKYIRTLFSVEYEHGFDLIIMSSGGFPFDNNFYQAYKGAYCLLDSLNMNGKIVIIAECPEGYGEKEGSTEFWFAKTRDELLKSCAADFDMNGKVAFDIKELAIKADEVFLATEDNEVLLKTVGITGINISGINKKIKKLINDFKETHQADPKICFIPYGTSTLVINKENSRSYAIPER